MNNVKHIDVKSRIKELFKTDPWTPSTLSDLCIGSGLIDYKLAVPNMTEGDAADLRKLVANLEKVRKKTSSSKEQRKLHEKIDRNLVSIIYRSKK